MRKVVRHFGICLVLAAAAGVTPATATVINFDRQAADRGGNLTGIPDSLTIGIATFSGGELLNAEVGLNADQTGVYATQGLFGSGETNPLVITFASPIDEFSVFVANGDDVRSYTVSDNLGDSIIVTVSRCSRRSELFVVRQRTNHRVRHFGECRRVGFCYRQCHLYCGYSDSRTKFVIPCWRWFHTRRIYPA